LDGGPPQPSRPALAAAVGLFCAIACAVVATLLGSAAADPAREQAARAAVEPPSAAVEPPSASAHSGDLGVRGVSERDLRAMETITLGREHAREHALIRRALRREDAGAVSDGGPAARTAAAAAADQAAAAAADPADVGAWETTKVPFPITAIHAAMLPTGKVMFFTYPQGENSAQAWLWDPAGDPGGTALVRKDPPNVNGKPANIWCAGQTFTADGELVVFGGNLEFPVGATSTWKGLNKVYTFDPFTETWHEQPDMRHGRWYPTGIRMADGRIPIISGLDESGAVNPSSTNLDVELFTPPASIGGTGTISLLGTVGGPGQPPVGGLYPHMFAMPSGRALVAGPAPQDTWFFDSLSDSGYSWSDVADLTRARSWGTTVPLPAGPSGSTKVMALGGSNWTETPSTRTTEVFDETHPELGWRAAAANVIGRGHANTVLLPDGSMVEVGGGIGMVSSAPSPLHAADPEQRQIEIWDPDTGEWQLGPAQTESRAYHSTALLLPDGRVMSAGDEWNGDGVSVDTAEVYKPPYLFRGPRPTIASAPQSIKVGADFGVTTPDTNIAGAALVAPAAVTHGVDMNQRMIQLAVTRRSGCVNIVAPSATVAPPGWYMLFLLNDQGVPSIAKFVKLQTTSTPAACTAPPLPTDTTDPTVSLTAPAAGSTVSGPVAVKASASDPGGVVVGVQFKRDGQNIGPEDAEAPFATSWDTTEAGNGVHQLTAVARDGAGRIASASVQVTVANQTATSPAGAPPPAGPRGTAKNLAPAISRLRLSRATFRKGSTTKVSFRLSEAAKVGLVFERKVRGRRARTHYARKKTLTLRGKAGPNTVLLQTRLWRTFAVGRYRLTVRATDATGKRSAPGYTSFRLLASAGPSRATAVRAMLGWF
jgi:hypothetical protein